MAWIPVYQTIILEKRPSQQARAFLLLVLSSADQWRRRTSRVWPTPAPKWWWPRPTWSPWTAKAGGRPYSAAPAWSTAPPGNLKASSDAPAQRDAHRGLLQSPSRRRSRARWTEWGAGGRRRAGRGTGPEKSQRNEEERDQNVKHNDVIVVSLSTPP